MCVSTVNTSQVPRVTNDGFFASTSCAAVSAWYCFTCKSVNFSVMFDGTVTQSLHHTSHHHTPLALALPYNLSPLQYDKCRVTSTHLCYTHLCYIPCTMIITVIAANGMYKRHSRRYKRKHSCYSCKHHVMFIILLTVMVHNVSAPDPIQRSDWDNLSNLNEWDGIPTHDFLFMWFMALGTALGAIVQDGYTLLDCALEKDIAEKTATDPDTQEKYKRRNARLAACILKYIKVGSDIYIYLKGEAHSDGVAVYKYVKHKGVLTRTKLQKEKLRNEFDAMTMANQHIRYTDRAIFEWRDLIKVKGRILGKSPSQYRIKFFEGFPEGFDTAIMPDRMAGGKNGLYTQPNIYPDWHPKAGSANPNGGEFDIDLAAESLYPEWSRRISQNLIRQIPKGMVRHIDDERANAAVDKVSTVENADVNTFLGKEWDSKMEELHAAITDMKHEKSELHDEKERLMALSNEEAECFQIASRKIGPDDICSACGGRGHFSRVGATKCLTITLGNRIPTEELLQTKYPRGLKYPNFKPRRGNPASEATASEASTSMVRKNPSKHTRYSSKSPKRPTVSKNKYGKKPARARTIADNSRESSDSEDDSSSESEHGRYVTELGVDFSSITVKSEEADSTDSN